MCVPSFSFLLKLPVHCIAFPSKKFSFLVTVCHHTSLLLPAHPLFISSFLTPSHSHSHSLLLLSSFLLTKRKELCSSLLTSDLSVYIYQHLQGAHTLTLSLVISTPSLYIPYPSSLHPFLPSPLPFLPSSLPLLLPSPTL